MIDMTWLLFFGLTGIPLFYDRNTFVFDGLRRGVGKILWNVLINANDEEKK